MDGRSYMKNGERRAGTAVVSNYKVFWSQRLPDGNSVQRAELIALTKALKLAKGKRATIYMDNRYVFGTAHVHGTIYQR